MVIGMATTKKITVSLPIKDVESVRRLVEANQADSVSGFVAHAVRVVLADVSSWQNDLRHALNDTGGPLTAEETQWAGDVLGLEKFASS